jgi:hypothetical protein
MPVSGVPIVRQRERPRVVTSPFMIGDLPNIRVGASAADLPDGLGTIAQRRNDSTA